MQNFIKDFKEFAMRGNIVDLATAVVIGTAFGKIVSSLVDNIIMPILGILLGGVKFSDKVLTFGSAQVRYGTFLQSVIEFVIIAFAIFLFLKVFNKVRAAITLGEKKKEEVPKPPSEEVQLLREIRDSLKK